MRRFVAVSFVLALIAVALVVGRADGRPGAGGIQVVPVNGKAVGHGMKLWVHVFYAKGGNPGPPPGHGGGGGGTVDCTDVDQSDYASPFAGAAPLTFHPNTSTFPSGFTSSAVLNALGSSAQTWNSASRGPSLLSIGSAGNATGPSQNNTSELGWARIAPKNVLAATWTWVNGSNQIVEADLFYNSSWTWDIFGGCPGSPTGHFDIQDIGTHELGHALGLNHVSDANAQATMYPSAPADEVRKRTLTTGDITALGLALG